MLSASIALPKNPNSLEEAKKFIELLTGDSNTECIFQPIQETEKKKRPFSQLFGSVEKHFEALTKYNEKGCGIFITVNECRGRRKSENVTKVRAAFYDFDVEGAGHPTSPLRPSLKIKSGRGVHGYFFLNDECPLDSFSNLQKSIANKLSTDSSISDLPRLMRLPGFFHLKNPKDPKLVTIEETTNIKYPYTTLCDAFPIRNPERRGKIQKVELNLPTSDFTTWARSLPVEEGSGGNSFGGRNKTALILVREGLGTNQNYEVIEEELQNYCSRSGLSDNEIDGMLLRQSNEHNIKKFQSYWLKKKNKKLKVSELAEDFLRKNGHYHFSSQGTLAYWRDNFYEYIGTSYRKIEGIDLDAYLTKYFYEKSDTKEYFNSKFLNEIKNYFKGVRHIPVSVHPGAHLKKNIEYQYYICLKNSILSFNKTSIDKVEIIENDPDLSTLGTINSNFDQNAKCPKWLEFLEQAIPDSSMRNTLQEWFGYNLIHDTAQARCLILFGKGANGKTVITCVLSTLLGMDNVSSIPLEALDPKRTFPMAAMVGKLANVVDEIGTMTHLAEGVFKQIIGGSIMGIEEKGKPVFQTYPTVRLTCATNNLPKFHDRTDGLWRRLILIPMNAQILNEDKQDKRLISPKYWEASGELPGIFNWAFEGLKTLIKRGHFEEPSLAADFKREFRQDNDHATNFLNENIIEAKNEMIGCSSLYRDYKADAMIQGAVILDPASFSRVVKDHFPNVTKTQNARLKNGLRERMWVGLVKGGMM